MYSWPSVITMVYKIGEETIHKSNKIRLLGVHLDTQVTLKEHMKLKSAKAAYNLHTI